MANYQELANLVWNVADDVLRGLFKPHEYGDISHKKKTKNKCDVFKLNFEEKIKTTTSQRASSFESIRIFCEDESRLVYFLFPIGVLPYLVSNRLLK